MSRPRGRSATSIVMEGYLTIPPERGSILGRALWKIRYVVIGSAQGEVNASEERSRSSTSSDGLTYLSIYKNPDDWEPSQQYAVCNITQCQVHMVSHRKQGPVLPTLILTINPDPTTEKLRKRRSSRAATLVSSTKDTGPVTLWFRTDSEPYRLHEWARCIQGMMPPNIPENLLPMSPISPASPSFNNPFSSRPPRDASEYSSSRPPSAPKPLQHKASATTTTTYSSRERPVTISDTPSLRSRRSDLSSLTSSNPPGTSQSHNYGPVFPSDLPSPATTPAVESFGGLIEGWTSAQGRSSVIMNSPVRGVRDSMGSMPQFSPATIAESGSPPFGRETILDRAFQLRYIPGSDQQVPGEEKLSSLARFEALMQQVERQRKLSEQREKPPRPPSTAQQPDGLKSAWDFDESDEETTDSDSDDTEGDSGHDKDDEASSVRPESRRAAGSLGGPKTPSHSPRGNIGPRSPISFNSETLAALSSRSTKGQGSHGDGIGNRLHSQTFSGMSNLNLGVEQISLDTSPGKSSIMSGMSSVVDETTGGLNPTSAYRTSTIAEGQQRHSMASSTGKRLSFTEFTRRLSSTSSMLLVQNNTSHQGGENPESPARSRRSSMQPRGQPCQLPSSPRGDGQDHDENCKKWRRSVDVLGGAESGFL